MLEPLERLFDALALVVKLAKSTRWKACHVEPPVSQEQMEPAQLRAELSRMKRELHFLKKATACFARESL